MDDATSCGEALSTLLTAALPGLERHLEEVLVANASGVNVLVPAAIATDSRYTTALLQEKGTFSKQILELLREWQEVRLKASLDELQTIFDREKLATVFSREESYKILQARQKKHCLLILVSPPKVSPSCPAALQHDLLIELPEELKQFLNQYFPFDSDLCPVDFYGDYFHRSIGDAEVLQLRAILSNMAVLVLYSFISDCKVYFHLSLWTPLSEAIAEYSLPAWNWEDAEEQLRYAGKSDRQSIRLIRRYIVLMHQLLAAFVTDW